LPKAAFLARAVLQSLAEPLKAMDGQMQNLPWTAKIRRKAMDGQIQNAPRKASILPGLPAFYALPGEKILAVR
jgi:hypothetical protein